MGESFRIREHRRGLSGLSDGARACSSSVGGHIGAAKDSF